MTTKRNDNNTMKVSRYTFFVEFDNRKFFYNTLSNALNEVDEELFNCLKARGCYVPRRTCFAHVE